MWASRRLRGERVWVKTDVHGKVVAGADGRVDVRYKPGGKVYRASTRNLEADPKPETLTDAEMGPAQAAAAEKAAMPSGAVIVYTDGACTGNPGPMGIGVVIVDGKERREHGEFLGDGTNNIAELTAIQRALEMCPRDRPVVVHSDSTYALGLLGKNWKAKANRELVAELRQLVGGFQDVRWVKVPAHSGVPDNERCDQLAREAILRRT
jgi:ribonuclease HI